MVDHFPSMDKTLGFDPQKPLPSPPPKKILGIDLASVVTLLTGMNLLSLKPD